jgi:hypothetical protein
MRTTGVAPAIGTVLVTVTASACRASQRCLLLWPAFDRLRRIASRRPPSGWFRAARAYQEGVWIFDSDPSEAWVRLIDAIQSHDLGSCRARSSI